MAKAKLKIYLETTLFNYYFLDDPTRQVDIEVTKQLLEAVKAGYFLGVVSDVTAGELEDCLDEKQREAMLELARQSHLQQITKDDYPGLVDLAEHYIQVGAIPRKKMGDALHIAAATLTNCDILVSWNYAHIVRYKTRQAVHDVNTLQGYSDIIISTPHELLNKDEYEQQ